MKPSKIKSAAVIANPKKPWAAMLRPSVISYLESRGIAVASNGAKADMAVMIGGDGTILYNKLHYGKIIFGIGSQTSFICQGLRSSWKKPLARFLSNPRVSERFSLCASLDGKKLPVALNDVAIKTRDHRIIRIKLRVNGRRFDFLADGIIFSTPTGSGAYAYSAGGREMPYESQDYQIVAIAPYRRAFKPMIVKGTARSSCAIVSECDVDVIVDGQTVIHAKNGMRLKVAKNSHPVMFAKA
ncbi:MAG: hypothetical protein WC506_02000 [Candidatus Micrarchaeia archaeon]